MLLLLGDDPQPLERIELIAIFESLLLRQDGGDAASHGRLRFCHQLEDVMHGLAVLLGSRAQFSEEGDGRGEIFKIPSENIPAFRLDLADMLPVAHPQVTIWQCLGPADHILQSLEIGLLGRAGIVPEKPLPFRGDGARFRFQTTTLGNERQWRWRRRRSAGRLLFRAGAGMRGRKRLLQFVKLVHASLHRAVPGTCCRVSGGFDVFKTKLLQNSIHVAAKRGVRFPRIDEAFHQAAERLLQGGIRAHPEETSASPHPAQPASRA